MKHPYITLGLFALVVAGFWTWRMSRIEIRLDFTEEAISN